MRFEEMGLSPEILKGLTTIGFSEATPIQRQVIEAVLNEQSDVIGIAQTGTGKTAAFGIPLIQLCDPSQRHVQSLILTPTRELCVQVASDLESIARHVKGLEVVAVYGGAGIDQQIRSLKGGNARIVVGTPGRTRDLIRRKILNVSKISAIVLDEADEMLSMGFKDDLDDIMAKTSADKHTMLFSATMPKEIAEIADKQMHDPIEIVIGKRNIGADNVDHFYYIANADDRYETLKRVVDTLPSIYGIVFCRTRKETREISEKLMSEGYNVDALHGDLSQAQRDYIMKRFREKNMRILVATDVAARGLDVKDLTHIINFRLPDETETYIHRSGRTGRAGQKGICLTIIHTREQTKLREIEKKVQRPFERKMIPSGEEICEIRLFDVVSKLDNVFVDELQIDRFMPIIYKKLEKLSKEELIKRVASIEFNRFLKYYENAPDLNNLVKTKSKTKSKSSKKSKGKSNSFTRLFINMGAKDRLAPANLIGLVNDCVGNRDASIGKIEIMKSFSFFEIDNGCVDQLMNGVNSLKMTGHKLVVELAQDKPNMPSGYTKEKTKKTTKGKAKRKDSKKGKKKRVIND